LVRFFAVGLRPLVTDLAIPFGDHGYPVFAYPAMDLSRPKRMRRPSAAARRMAQVSADRQREVRVLGVDMVESPWNQSGMRARCARKNMWAAAAANIFREGVQRRKD
jgi:hypothetical protein